MLTIDPAQQSPAPADLSTRALLVKYTATHWNISRRSLQIAREGAKARGVDPERARASVKIADCDELDECISYATAYRAWWRSITCPWWDNGVRILSAPTYQDAAAEALVKQEEYLQRLVPAFVAVYPSVRRDAPYALGAEYRAADFPDDGAIRDLFTVGFNVVPWPNPAAFRDLRTGLSQTDLDALVQQAAASERAVIYQARQDVLDRVRETVGHLVGKLMSYQPAGAPGSKAEGVFRDSLTENVRELVDVLPRLDFTGTWKLDDLAERIERECLRYGAETLRVDAHARETTAQAADRVLREMSAYV